MFLSSSRPSNSGLILCATSALVLGTAFLLWEVRSQAAQTENVEIGAANLASSTQNGGATVPIIAPTDSDVAGLLRRSFVTDNTLTFSADAETTAMYGQRKMKTFAHLARAPRRLTISYLSGDRRGLTAGYNEHWFWRREGKAAPMQAYASVALRPDEMASQRFALMVRNYVGVSLRSERVYGRLCDVVELRRRQHLDGTKGPVKQLWLDRESGLTLRTDAFNCMGNLVLRSTLANLRLAPHKSSIAFVTPATMKGIAQKTSWKSEELGANRVKVEQMTGIEPPEPRWLPVGFSFDSVGLHRASFATGSPLSALARYGDGLNVLTVFAFKTPKPKTIVSNSKASPKPDSEISCTFGAGAMAMRETSNGFTLVAVSDLPTPMLKRILESVSVK